MSEEAARQELVSQWLRKANLDRRTMHLALPQDPPMHDVVCFHAQECAEKLLKAYLQHHDHPISKTHDLVLLRQLAENIDPGFETLKTACRTLTDYGVDPRYPGKETTRNDAVEAAAAGEQMRSFILERLEDSSPQATA